TFARLAAEVCFVNFDADFKELAAPFVYHRKAYLLQYTPCGFIGNADFTLQLHARNAFFAVEEQMDRIEPFPQVGAGFLENRPLEDGELILAGRTLKILRIIGTVINLRFPAMAAHCPVRVANFDKVQDYTEFTGILRLVAHVRHLLLSFIYCSKTLQPQKGLAC